MSPQHDASDGEWRSLLSARERDCLAHILAETAVILALGLSLGVTGVLLELLNAPVWVSAPVKTVEWFTFVVAALRLVVGTLWCVLGDDVRRIRRWIDRRRDE